MMKDQSGERRKVAIRTGKPWRQVLEQRRYDERAILLTATLPENAV